MLDSKGIIGDFPIYLTFLKIRAEKCEFAVPEKKFGQKSVNSPYPTKIRVKKCECRIRRIRKKFGQKSVNSPHLIKIRAKKCECRIRRTSLIWIIIKVEMRREICFHGISRDSKEILQYATAPARIHGNT